MTVCLFSMRSDLSRILNRLWDYDCGIFENVIDKITQWLRRLIYVYLSFLCIIVLDFHFHTVTPFLLRKYIYCSFNNCQIIISTIIYCIGQYLSCIGCVPVSLNVADTDTCPIYIIYTALDIFFCARVSIYDRETASLY